MGPRQRVLGGRVREAQIVRGNGESVSASSKHLRDVFRASLVGSCGPPLVVPAGYLLECSPQFALCPVLGPCPQEGGISLVRRAAVEPTQRPTSSEEGFNAPEPIVPLHR